eukprot:10780317-Heterocapsa_arctica.AAC.1
MQRALLATGVVKQAADIDGDLDGRERGDLDAAMPSQGSPGGQPPVHRSSCERLLAEPVTLSSSPVNVQRFFARGVCFPERPSKRTHSQ